jgi:TMEM175 potassium channel family protein
MQTARLRASRRPVGAWLPPLGVAVIGAFILFYWLPIAGEVTGRNPQRRKA